LNLESCGEPRHFFVLVDACAAGVDRLLAQYIGYVKSEPLVAHIDQNPFGVTTNLRALLVGALTDAATAIG
jgi:hypothetical protein